MVSHMAKRLVCVALLLLVGRSGADEGSILRRQFIDWYTRGAPEARVIDDYVRRLPANGAWPDIDYSSDERGGWPPYSHLGRTLAMAEAYRKSDHPFCGATSLRDAIVRSLTHWTENDYICPNWWYPQIGVPKAVAPILILMGDDVPAHLRQRTIETILGRSKMGMTGQNKVWLAGIAFMKGMLADDRNLMTEARDQIFSELHVTTAEGIQPDYSFHQHGPQQQWGNYGAAFGSDMIEWASILRGTEYAMDPQGLDVLRHYLREGSAWVVWEGRMDISGCGRQIFRGCQEGKGRGILRQLELMTLLDPSEADKYAGLIAANGPDGTNAVIGHKHFWRSDMSVHRRPGWYASVKMSSTRVIGAETCNSENMLGLHLGDGVTYFLRTGDEYEDLFPVWDWRRLPGTTCLQDQGSLVPNPQACRGRSEFVGGVTNETIGVAAMEYLHEGLRARKTWFFLDEAVICLGAGIDSDRPESVLTSINQCALDGPVTIRADQRTRELPRGEHTFTAPDWAHHDGIGYLFLAPAQVHVGGGVQRGTWHAVHHRESRRTIERDVFNLWIDHGARPQDQEYAYAVLPGVTVSAMPARSASLKGAVLAHTGAVQAISTQEGKLLCAAFFEAGRLTCPEGLCIEVDVPCLVILDRTSQRTRLHVADPTHRHRQVVLRLSGAEYTVDLPVGELAGKTVYARDLPQFREHTISSELKYGYQLVAADLTQDGRTDLIAVDERATELIWFENGHPTWSRHVLAENVPRPLNADCWDLDTDGIPEVVLAYHFEPDPQKSIGSVVLLTSQNDVRRPWAAQEIDRVPTAHRVRWIDPQGNGKKVLLVGPMVGTKYPPVPDDPVPIYLYRPGAWKREILTTFPRGVLHAINPVPRDGGAGQQLLTACYLGLHRIEFDRGPTAVTAIAEGDPRPWPQCGSSEVRIGHLGDHRFLAAIEPWHGNQLVVYLPEGESWKRLMIEDKMDNGHALAVGDLDGDGRDEIVCGFRGKGCRLSIYQAAAPRGERWQTTVLDGAIAAADCVIGDFTHDGKLDIACIGASTHNLKLYENLGR